MKNIDYSSKLKPRDSLKTTVGVRDSLQPEISTFSQKKKSMIDFDNVMEGYISFGGDKDKPFFREPSYKGNWERVYNHIYHTKDNI